MHLTAGVTVAINQADPARFPGGIPVRAFLAAATMPYVHQFS